MAYMSRIAFFKGRKLADQEATTEMHKKDEFHHPGVTTLAITVGTIIGCFIVLVLIHHGIRRYLCCKRCEFSQSSSFSDASSNSQTLSTQVSTNISMPEIASIPPSYSEIHLYKQLDVSSCTPVYYSVPGMKNHYGILLKTNINEEDLEEHPPAYEESVEESSDVISINSSVERQSESVQSIEV